MIKQKTKKTTKKQRKRVRTMKKKRRRTTVDCLAFVVMGRRFFRRELQISPSPIAARRACHPIIPPCWLQLAMRAIPAFYHAGCSSPPSWLHLAAGLTGLAAAALSCRFQHRALLVPTCRYHGRSTVRYGFRTMVRQRHGCSTIIAGRRGGGQRLGARIWLALLDLL